jgi:AcrR family transcriptional regulator
MDEMQWVRPPKQERSQKTLDVFLNSVETLLEEQGVETLSVKDIAARANLSVGGFYARFPNKEAVLRALHLRFSTEAKATVDVALDPKRWRGVHLSDATPKLVHFLADDYRKRPGLRRAFLLLNGTDAEVKMRSQEVSGYAAGRFHGFLADKAGDMEHDDLMLASDMLHRMLFSMLDNYALFQGGTSTGRGIQHDVFVSELSGAVVRYLRVKPKPENMPAFDPMTLPVIGATLSSLGSAETTLPSGHGLPARPAGQPGSLPAADVPTVPVKNPNSEW